MIADRLLNKLDGVRETGQDRWIARCPAHEDKSPSLAIRQADDRLLLHCFAGCSVHDVIGSVGLDISALFPDRVPVQGNRPLSRPFPAADVLRCLATDFTFMIVCASDLAKGEALEPDDKDKLIMIAARLRQALNYTGIAA